ncbi:hypothetical protein B0H11DRAFT_1911711 [Mycena galericulata]|nr:hypothetical protein B0H11DRAFT_1911711 [Mycena galericulata]
MVEFGSVNPGAGDALAFDSDPEVPYLRAISDGDSGYDYDTAACPSADGTWSLYFLGEGKDLSAVKEQEPGAACIMVELQQGSSLESFANASPPIKLTEAAGKRGWNGRLFWRNQLAEQARKYSRDLSFKGSIFKIDVRENAEWEPKTNIRENDPTPRCTEELSLCATVSLRKSAHAVRTIGSSQVFKTSKGNFREYERQSNVRMKEAKERNGIRRMTRPRVERGYAADEENDRNIFDPGVKKQRTIETNSAYQPTTRPRVERAYSTSPLKNGLTWRRRATQNQVLTRVAGAGMRKSLVGGVGRRAKGIRGKRITRRSTLKSWIRIERWDKGDQKKNASQRHRTGSRVEREYSADDTENMGTERWSSSSGLMGSPWLRNARGILRAQREPRAV